ncbi:MAG: hypothetical protein ACPG77_20035, partial [Nannocystaceae bacterium]
MRTFLDWPTATTLALLACACACAPSELAATAQAPAVLQTQHQSQSSAPPDVGTNQPLLPDTPAALAKTAPAKNPGQQD